MVRATQVIDGRKACTRCMETKPVEAFPVHAKTESRQQRYRHWCRECSAAYLKEWYRKRGGKTAYYRERGVGVAPAQYQQMSAAQGGVCAICLTDPTGKTKTCDVLHVDHDHASGVVRGLLCMKCNRALGLFGDNVDALRAAVAYLLKHQRQGVM